MKRAALSLLVVLVVAGVLALHVARQAGAPKLRPGAPAPSGVGARASVSSAITTGEGRARARPSRAPILPGATLARAAWGRGPGELGRSRPIEANPEAPSSFTLDAQGRLLVLDNVNGRIVRFDRDGKPAGAFRTTSRSPQEILTAPDGALLVMDRLADRSVAVLDEDGRLQGELPVVGKGMEQGGSATGLFADDHGVYVEREHRELIRIGDTTGRVDAARPTLDGRPSRDGASLLTAGVIDPAAGRFWVRAVDRTTGEVRFQKVVTLGVPYLSIVFLDSDRAGGLYAGAHVGRELAPGKMAEEAVQVVCLGPAGEVRGVAVLPANTMPEESFRDLAVTDDGTLLYMERTPDGVAIRSYRCS